MTHPTRRALLALASTVRPPAAVAQQAAPPAMGAIRWDAWYAPGSAVTEAMVRSLSPPAWRARAPFFAEVPAAPAPIRLPAPTQAVMDREIEVAAAAGLDFWAFLAYPAGSSMTAGFALYRASANRARVKFCLIIEAARLGGAGALSAVFDDHPALLADPDYQRVAGDRPLYCIGFLSDDLMVRNWGGTAPLRAALDEFRRRVQAAGAANPYLVLMTPVPEQARRWVPLLGADAVAAYVYQAGARAAPYAALADHAERGWAAHGAAGLAVVPTAMAGWDRRPRVQNPVPWEAWQRAGEGLDRYYAAPTPAELSRHITRARDYAATQPARAGLVYAWNENDEGGWLIPTTPAANRRLPVDDSRLRSLRDALCRSSPADRCVRR